MGLLKRWFDLGADPVPSVPKVRYSEIRPFLEDLDVILWTGKGRGSRIIRWGTGGWASHTSTVKIARVPSAPLGHETEDLHRTATTNERLFLSVSSSPRLVLNLESTTLNRSVRDYYSRTVRSGSQVNALSERLSSYGGRVFVRRLIGDRSRAVRERYEMIRKETSGRTYERSLWELIGSAVSFIRNRPDPSSLFCSELSALALQTCGVLELQEPANEYSPESFQPEEKLEKRLLPGWFFVSMVEIDLEELRSQGVSEGRTLSVATA